MTEYTSSMQGNLGVLWLQTNKGKQRYRTHKAFQSKEKSGPWHLGTGPALPAGPWYCYRGEQRGRVVPLLNTNNFTDHHQTSLLCDYDAPGQKQHPSLTVCKHRKNRNIVQATKMTKHPFSLTDCGFFTNYSINTGLVFSPCRRDEANQSQN